MFVLIKVRNIEYVKKFHKCFFAFDIKENSEEMELCKLLRQSNLNEMEISNVDIFKVDVKFEQEYCTDDRLVIVNIWLNLGLFQPRKSSY